MSLANLEPRAKKVIAECSINLQHVPCMAYMDLPVLQDYRKSQACTLLARLHKTKATLSWLLLGDSYGFTSEWRHFTGKSLNKIAAK